MAAEKKNFPERKRKGKLRTGEGADGEEADQTTNLLEADTPAPQQSVEDLLNVGAPVS